MGCCFPKQKPLSQTEFSVVYESDSSLLQPLISHTDFLMRESVIEAQFEEHNIEGKLSFYRYERCNDDRHELGE